MDTGEKLIAAIFGAFVMSLAVGGAVAGYVNQKELRESEARRRAQPVNEFERLMRANKDGLMRYVGGVLHTHPESLVRMEEGRLALTRLAEYGGRDVAGFFARNNYVLGMAVLAGEHPEDVSRSYSSTFEDSAGNIHSQGDPLRCAERRAYARALREISPGMANQMLGRGYVWGRRSEGDGRCNSSVRGVVSDTSRGRLPVSISRSYVR